MLKSFFRRRQRRLPSPLTRLWFDPDGRTAITPDPAKEALLVLDPVADCATELTDWVRGSPRPAVGRFGHVDRRRETVCDRAEQMPAVSVVASPLVSVYET